jgi:hypothetical protein
MCAAILNLLATELFVPYPFHGRFKKGAARDPDGAPVKPPSGASTG